MTAFASFHHAIARARTAPETYGALQSFCEDLIGARLFTVMILDMEARLVRRVHSSDPKAYPIAGTKPIVPSDWFRALSEERRPFVTISPSELAQVFPDHETIATLGCGSSYHHPVFIRDQIVATVNLLHEAGYYDENRVSILAQTLPLPAFAAVLVAQDVS